MNKSKLISIVIPAYNMECFVTDAIVSCLNQTYEDREIIVIDDGSKDGTKSIVEKFGPKVSYFYQENAGVSAARNHGIMQAKGQYISFLDADDIWLPNKLESQMAMIKENSSIKAVGCGYSIMDESSRIVMNGILRDNYRNREELYRVLSICQIIPGSSSGLLIEKKILEEIGCFDETLFIGEDWDMWLRIAELEQIHFVVDILVILRNRNKKEAIRSFENERLQVEKVIAKSVKNRYQHRAYAALYARLGSSFLSSNRIDLAIRYLAKSIKSWPFPIFPNDLSDKYKYPKRPRYYLLSKALLKITG